LIYLFLADVATIAKMTFANMLLCFIQYGIKVVPHDPFSQVESAMKIRSGLPHHACIRRHKVLRDDMAASLVTDHVSNGTLLQHINHSQTFTKQDEGKILTQLFEGLGHLHEVEKIAHLDLKLENVMIDSKSDVKIINFGQAHSFDSLARLRGPLHWGSLPCCAPEIVSGNFATPVAEM
jgi:serine/threonine protein kinase